ELDRDPVSGLPRSTAGDGLYDVFPRVFLKQVTHFDETGVEAAVSNEEAAVIPGRVIPMSELPLLLAAAPGAAPIAVDTLNVLVEPLAVALTTQQRVAVIPRGKYQVVVVEKSGQVWTLPNSLGDPARSGT